MLRPFLSYYGGKWLLARRYPKPVGGMVIEPFAGGAGYSCYWEPPRVLLVERDPVVAAVWRYLIRTPAAEIRRLPILEIGQSVGDLPICQEARWLIGYWIQAACASAKLTLSSYGREHTYAGRIDPDRGGPSGFWSIRVRERIASQVDRIRHWELIEGDYTAAANLPVTWFVDPPYCGQAGKAYRFNSEALDFAVLADWCKGRKGQVIVCEGPGANWLPFDTLKAKHGRLNANPELVYIQGCKDPNWRSQ